MFDIILQYNKSEPNQITKTVDNIITVQGTMREECDISNPQMLIDVDISTIANANYFTIANFGRKYFMTKAPTLVTNNLVLIEGHIDVLSTYDAQIRAQRGIVRRSAQRGVFNTRLNDGSIKAYQNPHIITKAFPGSFSGYSFVLAVAGSSSAQP